VLNLTYEGTQVSKDITEVVEDFNKI